MCSPTLKRNDVIYIKNKNANKKLKITYIKDDSINLDQSLKRIVAYIAQETLIKHSIKGYTIDNKQIN